MAWLRVVRSLARRVLCSVSDCPALRATVSSRARLSPRRGTRRLTGPPRRSASQWVTVSASGGSSGTSTSRGTPLPGAPGPVSVTLTDVSPYTWPRKFSTSSPVVTSSTFSTTQPR